MNGAPDRGALYHGQFVERTPMRSRHSRVEIFFCAGLLAAVAGCGSSGSAGAGGAGGSVGGGDAAGATGGTVSTGGATGTAGADAGIVVRPCDDLPAPGAWHNISPAALSMPANMETLAVVVNPIDQTVYAAAGNKTNGARQRRNV